MKTWFAFWCLSVAVALSLAVPVHSQDTSAPTIGVSRNVEMQGLGNDVKTMKAKVVSATTRLMKIKSCHASGMIFRTRTDGTEGCKSVVPCQLPWGKVLSVGETATAYQAATVSYGQSCTAENRTCTDDRELTGSFMYQSCAAGPAPACNLPWGGTLASGGGIMAYAAPTVSYGQSCAGEGRYCNEGTLSGSYGYPSCSVNAGSPYDFGCRLLYIDDAYYLNGDGSIVYGHYNQYVCMNPIALPGYNCMGPVWGYFGGYNYACDDLNPPWSKFDYTPGAANQT